MVWTVTKTPTTPPHVILENRTIERVPFGFSIGVNEAVELMDNNKNNYFEKGDKN